MEYLCAQAYRPGDYFDIFLDLGSPIHSLEMWPRETVVQKCVAALDVRSSWKNRGRGKKILVACLYGVLDKTYGAIRWLED